MAVAEHYVEVIAHKLGLDIDHIRQVCLSPNGRLGRVIQIFVAQINLYKEGEKTPYHQKVDFLCHNVLVNVFEHILRRSLIGMFLVSWQTVVFRVNMTVGASKSTILMR